MNQRPETAPDRRRHVRIEPKGTVAVYANEDTVRGRLANIGGGGMYVATNGSFPEHLLLRIVDLELRFDGAPAAWQRARGRVVRITSTGAAIVFEQPTAPLLLAMIDGLSTASYASARVISVVLIDADAPRRAAIAGGFRTAGCEVLEVSTQLEAIVRLGESHFEPDIIAVANTQPISAAEQMRSFVKRYHPSSMLVAIGPELLDPTALVDWLSEATATAGLPARIRELLFAPRRG